MHYFSTLKSPLVLISEDHFHCLHPKIIVFRKENLTSQNLGKNPQKYYELHEPVYILHSYCTSELCNLLYSLSQKMY